MILKIPIRSFHHILATVLGGSEKSVITNALKNISVILEISPKGVKRVFENYSTFRAATAYKWKIQETSGILKNLYYSTSAILQLFCRQFPF